MLSGGNTVAAGGASGIEDHYSSSSTTMDGKRKAEMTAEEKANYERERNRVHARNTRARKKQYMEELKERVENMHAQRAAVERQKEDVARQEEEQIVRWEKTLGKIMELRCEGVTEEATWKEVLADSFRFTLPLTPYRAYNPADIIGHRRVLLGIEGMISDATSLKEMCDKIAQNCRKRVSTQTGGSSDAGSESRVRLKCFLGTGDFLFSGTDGIMCMFNTRTINAREFGSAIEVEASGMLRASFSEDGKLEELVMMFDGVAVHQQMQRAIGSDPTLDQADAATAAGSAADKEGTQAMSPPLVEDAKGLENLPPSRSASTTSTSPAPIGDEESGGVAELVEGGVREDGSKGSSAAEGDASGGGQ